MIANEPTNLSVPDRFRKEVQSAHPEEIDNLRESVVMLHRRRIEPNALAAKIADGGWSSEFASWYSDNVTLHGPYLQLTIPKQTAAAMDRAEFRENVAKSEFRARAQLGTALAAVAYAAFSNLFLYPVGTNKLQHGVGIQHGVGRKPSFVLPLVIFLVALGSYAYDRMKGRYEPPT